MPKAEASGGTADITTSVVKQAQSTGSHDHAVPVGKIGEQKSKRLKFVEGK